MKTRKKSRKHWSRAALLFMAFLLIPWTVPNATYADSTIVDSTKSAGGVGALSGNVIAEWIFENEGENGIHLATGGQYQSASILQNIGGSFENYEEDEKEISYQGWDNGEGKKYWLATVSTATYGDITLSSEQTSSGSGPNDFKVQISTDRSTWTDVPNGTLQMNTCPEDGTCKLDKLALPKKEADDKELLYIRWLVNSNSATNAKENPDGIGGGGSSRIRNISVEGVPIPGKVPVQPTIDLMHLPGDGAKKVSATDPFMVKFNKEVTLVPDQAITVVDEQNQTAPGLQIDVKGNMLRVEHDALTYGTTYTVTIPKATIHGVDGIPLVRDISWSFTTQASPFMPKLINMVFNGDPKTSIALAWYTDITTDTKVQVVEASQIQGNEFPKDKATEYTGKANEIFTYMTKDDRSSNEKTKFFSHKVIADHLKPGTEYKFRVGNGTEWSSIGSFMTDTATPQPYRFIVGSDSQASSESDFEPWADTFKKADNYIGNPKFLISAGDLVDNGDLEEQWQWMLGLAQEPLLKVPYVPVLGGHEISDYEGDETTPNNNFYNHFNLPQKVVDATHDGSVYSFEYGDGLYMVFNSQFDGKVNEDGSAVDWDDDKKEQFWNQVTWMQNTVAKTDKKWKFVMFHKSPYAAGDNSAQWEDQRVQFYRKNLIPVFDELGIDMVFEAHDHMYMRSFQMYGDKVINPEDLKKDDEGNVINPKGTVYLMSNAFGNKFYYKNNQYKNGPETNWEPVEIKDKYGNPIPYDDYFAAIDKQPEKKMFTDVSLSDQVLKFDAMTAAVKDEGKEGTKGTDGKGEEGDFLKNGLFVYDHYGIKRTDTKPAPVVEAKVELQGNKAILTWKAPASSKEPVRGFRVYEKDDKVSKHWSVYQQVKENTTQYSLTIEDLNPAIQYNLVIKAVGSRDNSEKVEVRTLEGPSGNEPPSAPTHLVGKAISPFQIDLSWTESSGTKPAKYHVYRNGLLAGKTQETSFTDIGLDPNSEYQYTVKAVNESGVESLASNEIRLKTKPSSNGSSTLRPFPQHTSFAAGSIKPNHQPQAQIDATVARLFDEWKKKYLKPNPYLKESDPSQYYVWYADGDWFEKEHDDELDVEYDAITVSEAHGYGMLITANMAGHDPEAKSYFDGLYRYFRVHPSSINPDLMAWKQGDTGQDIVDVDGVDSATDGDMDIAYALLLADSQWGSGGEINYLAEAKKVINAIMKSDVNHTEWTLKLADWVDDSDPKYGTATRSSDFMLQHLRDFRNVTGDRNWDLVIDKTYSITQELYKNFSPNAGLLPDFVVKKDGKYVPVPAEPIFLESETDGDYSYNSSRTPWRIGTDYLLTGDDRAKGQLNKLTDWIRKKTNDDPSHILAGYKLDGSEPLEEYSDNSFSAPMMVAAMLDAKNQDWLNRLWDHNVKLSTDEDVYFGNTLRLLSTMVVSGNWWSPTIVDTEAPMEPTIEKAVAISNTAIELKWTPSSDNMGVVGYKVYRDDALIATTDKTEFRDSGLMPNTKYRYFVVAYDAAGNLSKISNIRVVTTQDSAGGGSDTGNSSNGSSGSSGNSTNPVPVPVPETKQPDKTPSFSDVGARFDWAKTAIEYLAAKGFIKGTADHTFEPGKNITRADFVLLLVRVFGFEGVATSNFKDVASDSYYYDALSIAKKIGLTIGTGGDRFEPKAFISRQEMMVLLTRALKLDKLKIDSVSDLSGFTDTAKLADYAKESAALLVKEGIIQGDSNALRPEQTLTRAEAAVLIYRVIKKYF